MDIKYINSHNISKELSLRFDNQFIIRLKDDTESSNYTFSDLYETVKDNRIDYNTLKDDFYYCQIGDTNSNGEVYPVILNFNNQNIEDSSYYKKIEKRDIIKCEEGDILISKIRPYLRKIIYINKEKSNIFYTSAFIHLRPKKDTLLSYIYLKEFLIEEIVAVSRIGKGYPTINDGDLQTILLSKPKVDNLFNNYKLIKDDIESKYNAILDLQKNKENDIDIINQHIYIELGFSKDELEEIKKENVYKLSSSYVGNNIDLRFGVRFHRPASYYITEELETRFNKRIKDYLDIPITLGSSVSPNDFDSTGTSYFISMATIKSYNIDLEDSQLLSEDYTNAQIKKGKHVKDGDIIMARSGVAIGKIALVEEDIDGVYADFTMRIRLKNYNTKFAYFYFRSDIFQYLIERNKKGVQNQNIFPKIVQDFPIPDITIEEQNKIVSLIERDLNKKHSSQLIVEKIKEEIIIKLDELMK